MALPTASTPVAKSLHTLTVLQQVAMTRADTGASEPFGPNNNEAEAAIDFAMTVLGLAGRPDPYGLRARALELMTRNTAKEA
jgi:hypothetical protein